MYDVDDVGWSLDVVRGCEEDEVVVVEIVLVDKSRCEV